MPSKQYLERATTGFYGECWVMSELARRGIKSQRLNELCSGADIITQNNYIIEVKSSQAHITDKDKEHIAVRSWHFGSIRKPVAKSPDVLVLLAFNESGYEPEHCWIIKWEDLKGRTGDTKNNFVIKDTKWQKKYSRMACQVSEKWVEKYKDKWEYIK